MNDQPESGSERDETLDPAEMLALMQSQKDRTSAGLMKLTPMIVIVWGVSWILGFFVLWIAPSINLDRTIAYIIFGALLAVAVVFSAVGGARMGKGHKPSASASFSTTAFIVAACLCFVGVSTIGSALIRYGMDRELADRYFPTVSVLTVGVMYAVAAAIWRIKPALWVGVFLAGVAMLGAFLPAPHFFLLYSILGGGVMLGYGLVLRAQVERKLRS